MNPERLEVVGEFLAIRWPDGVEHAIELRQLREKCPCARCSGETDVTGTLRTMGPPPTLGPDSSRPVRWERIGHYAVQPTWADGHDTGIFSFDFLRGLGEEAAES